MAELVYATDLKSVERKFIWVRFPFLAPLLRGVMIYQIIPFGQSVTSNPPLKHCWQRLRFHKWGQPFKRKSEAVSVWLPCIICGWITFHKIDESIK